MKRILIAATLVLAGGWTPAAQATSQPPRAELTHDVCRQAQNPSRREISVTAVMRPLPGTEHMAIKFSLSRQAAGARAFSPVRGGNLDKWVTPKDSTLGQRAADIWRLGKVVSDLAGPAVYRLKVTFRWTDAHHRVLGRAVRNTPVCRAD
ncbi:MAG TPA: hypothetical protein VMU90_03085 [Solirubrobacteraceae bacterium]|nr:hypothetical protein [Solirubrobacteraceae bacterium]